MKHIYICVVLLMITKLSFSQEIGAPAPDFTLLDSQNREFKLSDHKGIVIAAFMFGYGCTGCIAVAPDVQSEVAGQFSSYGDFLMIGIDVWNGSSKQIADFVSLTKIDFETLQMGSDLAQLWKTTYDRLVVIDKEGRIAFKGNGIATNHIAQAITAIETALFDEQTSILNFGQSNENELSILPNPVIDKATLNFNLTKSQKVRISVYDLSGKTVYQNEKWVSEDSNSMELDGTTLKSGIHFMQVNTEKTSFTKRFIVK